MHEKQKNRYVVRIEDEFGFFVGYSEYVGGELGFWVWYKQLMRTYPRPRPDLKLLFPYYSHPVTEG